MKWFLILMIFYANQIASSFKSSDSNFKYDIEYALESSPTEWIKRGFFSPNNKQKIQVTNNKLTDKEYSSIVNECKLKGKYIIRVSINNFSYISNTPACDLIESNLNDKFIFSFSDDNNSFSNLNSISYKVNKDNLIEAKNNQFTSNAILLTNSKINSLNFGADPKFKEPNNKTNMPNKDEKEEEPSFFKKYWWMILIVIFMLNSKLPGGDEGEQKGTKEKKDN